jgi:outer membrane protein TolC
LFVLDKNAKKETDKAISLYKAGLSSELDLKTQELSNLSVESNINLTNLNLILSQLTLFKSLGGAPHA